jgi:hypothetical protein
MFTRRLFAVAAFVPVSCRLCSHAARELGGPIEDTCCVYCFKARSRKQPACRRRQANAAERAVQPGGAAAPPPLGKPMGMLQGQDPNKQFDKQRHEQKNEKEPRPNAL